MLNTTQKLVWRVLRYPLLVLCVVATTYALSNLPAFYKNTSYWLVSHFWQDKIAEAADGLEISSEDGEVKLINTGKQQQIKDNSLVIPRLGMSVPVLWQINNSEKDIQSALQNGVVNIAGTALPGNKGNVFITGHSSNYLWSKGDYKTTFSLLSNLRQGDLIYVKYANSIFAYRTESITTVRPNRLDIMGPTEKPTLTLMTCTPIGTAINRLVVTAWQVHPKSPSTKR